MHCRPHRRHCWNLFAGVGILFFACTSLKAQIQFEIRGAILPWNLVPGYSTAPELTPAQVELIPGTVQTRLEQAEALGAAGEWEETIDTLLDIMAEPGAGLVEVSPDRFIPLREFCQQRIARLPPEALSIYRGRVDATAETWYREGLSRRDRAPLLRIVDEMLCSSWGDDALWALGEMALEAGDYEAARWHWERISPLLRSPAGQSAWVVLTGIDFDQHSTAATNAWQTRDAAPDWLAYPDTELDLAQVRARLALVSIRAGNLERAELEMQLLQQWHPDTQGQIAGRRQNLYAALRAMLDNAHSWPQPRLQDDWTTIGGGPARNGRAASLGGIWAARWEKPVSFVPATTTFRHTIADDSGAAGREHHRPLRYHPVVVDGRVLICGSRHVQALELATGRAAITEDGLLFRSTAAGGDPPLPRPTAIGPLHEAVQEDAHYTLSSHAGVVYARMGSPVTSNALQQRVADPISSDQALVGLDLSRDALLTFKAEPENGNWTFEGAPLCDANSLYVALRQNDVKERAHIACYDLATGRRRWQTALCAADTPTSGERNEISNGLLTLVGDTIYFNTNLGAIAAVDKNEGRIRWIRRYDRASATASRPAPHLRRALAPCVFHEGMVMAAPTDTPLVFALDAATGKTLWVCEHAGDAIDLVGVAEGNLLATGDRCRGLDVRTGKLRFLWPETEHSGIVGRGRGCVAGDELFWPTRRQIYVLDAATGAQTRTPIDISLYSEDGANLVAAEGLLLVAGTEQLIALGPHNPPPSPGEAEKLSWFNPPLASRLQKANVHE